MSRPLIRSSLSIPDADAHSGTPGQNVKFRVLGPLEVVIGHQSADLGGAKGRIIMAMFLLAAGSVVSVSSLVDAVWGDNPPRSSAKSVQNGVSALRRRLEEAGATPKLIEFHHIGYRLDADTCLVDASQFTLLVRRGRKLSRDDCLMEAAEAFRQALALWRGPAYDGISSKPVEAGAVGLDQERISVLSELMDAELLLGRHNEIIGELHSLVAKFPYQEVFTRQLMLALFAAGRQADALMSFHRLKARLQDQLGIIPSGELLRLYEAILHGEVRDYLPRPRSS
jgi:DNA-binding SARP family transcriptional activator